jgi:anti-anti-sigma factor
MHIYRRENVGDIILITLEIQSIETTNSRKITQRVAEAMSGGGRIVVDLGELRYFDVTGFAAILNWAAGGTQKAEVRFCSQSGTIRALFELLRANAVVPLYRSREEAMASFRSHVRRGAEVLALREEDTVLPGRRIA